MVSFPPLLPDAAWCSRFFRSLMIGKTETQSIEEANSALRNARELTRFSIKGNNGNPITLSMAVEGGNRKLRHRVLPPDINLSEHGDWRKVHLGALEACLGKKPFYPYIIEGLAKTFNDRELKTPADFNTAIFETLKAFLMKGLDSEDLLEFERNDKIRLRGKEIAENIGRELSCVQAITQYGREALIGFMALEPV